MIGNRSNLFWILIVTGHRMSHSWQDSLTTERALHTLRAWLYLPSFAELPVGPPEERDSTEEFWWYVICDLKLVASFENPQITDEEGLEYILRRCPHLSPDDIMPPLGYTVRDSIAVELNEVRNPERPREFFTPDEIKFEREDEEFYRCQRGYLAVDFENERVTPAQAAAIEYLLQNEDTVLDSVLAAMLDEIVRSGDKQFLETPPVEYVREKYSCQRILGQGSEEDGIGYLEFSFDVPEEEKSLIRVVTLGGRVQKVVGEWAEDDDDSSSWRHPELGVFRKSKDWAKTVILPEYNVFCCEGSRDADEITLVCESDANAVQTLNEFWQNRPSPVQIREYLWADFNDEWGSGNWWTDDSSWSPTSPRPASAEELNSLLNLRSVSVVHFPEVTGKPVKNPFTGEFMDVKPGTVPRPGFWAIDLTFHASFEEEHGIGLLWHRGQFVGSGYGYGDARPSRSYDPRA